MTNASDTPPANGMKHSLNLPLLVGTVITVLLLIVGGTSWVQFQQHRMADAFIGRAAELEESSDWRSAADYIFRYLELRPDDNAAVVRLAVAFDRSNSSSSFNPRAIELYYQALGVATPQQEVSLRTRLTELLLEQKRFVEAAVESQELIDGSRESDGRRFLALALVGQFREGQLTSTQQEELAVGTALETAVATNPQDITLAATWARILRDEPNLLSKRQHDELTSQSAREKRADSVLDQLVEDNPQSVEGWLARYNYRTEYRLAGAESDLETALNQASDRPEVLLVAARHFHNQAAQLAETDADAANVHELYKRAIGYYQEILDQVELPTDAVYIGLGDAYVMLDQHEEAVRVWRDGLIKLKGISETALQGRLAERLIALGRLEEADAVIEQLDQRGKELESDFDTPTRLTWKRGRNLLKATWLSKKDQPLKVIPLAGPIATDTQSTNEERIRAWLLLGESYADLGRWDQAGTAYGNAADLNIADVGSRVAASAAWMNSGQPSKAMERLREALQLTRSVEILLRLGHAQLAHQVTMPPSRRDWAPLEQTTRLITDSDFEQLSESWRVALLQADYLVARNWGQDNRRNQVFEQAKILLNSLEKEYSEEPLFWQQLVLRYERIGHSADADRALATYQRLGSSPNTSIVAARLFTARKQSSKARQVLLDALSSASDDQAEAIRLQLVRVSIASGDAEGAKQGLQEFGQSDPASLVLMRQLGDLMLDNGDLESAAQIERLAREVEGDEPTLALYFEARRILMELGESGDTRFDKVARLQEEITRRRPSWSAGYMLRGALEQSRGNPEQAIEAYQTAMRLGERRVGVYEQLISLFYRLGRFSEADMYLAQLDAQVPTSGTLSSLAISNALGRNDLVEAEALARQGVVQRPADPMAWVWLGQLLTLNDQLSEAHDAFRRAVALNPTDVRAWNGLFDYQLESGATDAARMTLDQIAVHAELSDVQRAFVLAQGYERLGDQRLAEEKYSHAATMSPESTSIQTRIATFYLEQGDDQRAEVALRRVLELGKGQSSTPAVADNARRKLASILAERGGEQEFKEALALLQDQGPDRQISELDKRLQAVLLAQRPNSDLRKAQQLLEDLVLQSKTASPGDHLLLAWVYLKQSESLFGAQKMLKQESARERYETVCFRANPQVSHMLLYVDLLVNLQDWETAERWLGRLRQSAPNDPRVLMLQAHSLAGQGRRGEVQPAIEAFVKRAEVTLENHQQRVDLYMKAGEICANAKLNEAAENWYRRAVEISPSNYTKLAESLVSQGKIEAAVQLCLERSTGDSPRSASVLAMILASGQVSPDSAPVAESVLTQALSKFRNDAELTLAMANLRATQQNTTEAVTLYRRALSLNPQSVGAMNNLAILLSEELDELQSALQLIDQAIDLRGPLAPLLDTKAMILVLSDRPEQAIDLLRRAAADRRADPRYHFHLAVALQRTGDLTNARSALETAMDADLMRQVLTTTDRRLLSELEDLLQSS